MQNFTGPFVADRSALFVSVKISSAVQRNNVFKSTINHTLLSYYKDYKTGVCWDQNHSDTVKLKFIYLGRMGRLFF